ncbi:MAG TPA: hypothetical protein ENF80_02605 [Thermofilum sp.]|nr:hypothetical protein [Thermofilum sp.]
MSGDNVKVMAEAKAYLEKRLEELSKEVEMIRLLLKVINEALSQQSFMPASELQKPVEAEKKPEPLQGKLIESSVLTYRTGEELAAVEVYDTNLLVIRLIAKLSASTQPLQAFLVRKLLEPYRKKDEERVIKGEIDEDQAFRYEIIEKDGLLKEIRIYNYGDRSRLLELKSAIRWTLSKMLEKEKEIRTS